MYVSQKISWQDFNYSNFFVYRTRDLQTSGYIKNSIFVVSFHFSNFSDMFYINLMFYQAFNKAQKTWIQYCASLKKLEKHEFNFLQTWKISKSMHLIFCKLKKAQTISFLQASKSSKSIDLIFCKLEKVQKTWIWFCAI